MLMDGENTTGRIHDGCFERARPPDKPVVPRTASESKRRNTAVEASGKDKIIDSHGRLQFSFVGSSSPGVGLPAWRAETERGRDPDVRPTANHQKWAPPSRYLLDRIHEVAKQEDVGIDVAKEVKIGRASCRESVWI